MDLMYSWKPTAPTYLMDCREPFLAQIGDAKLEVWLHQSDEGWWDRADGRPGHRKRSLNVSKMAELPVYDNSRR